MYTAAKNVQIVLVLLKEHNIRHIVISPGGTNIPIVQGVQNDPFFTCYSVVDERSAIYFAIGLFLKLGVPIATSCTSAQATRNYIPGLTEAFYKHVPILAITTSKHPRFTYQEFMQAPDQTSLPVDAVKQSFSLPCIHCNEDEFYCERLVNEAILKAIHRIPGPVQLNIPIEESHRIAFSTAQLPSVRIIKRYSIFDEWDIQIGLKKVMIVVGEHRPFTSKQQNALEQFTESHNAFIYANHLSNFHGKYVIYGNLALFTASFTVFRELYKPDILITIGGQTGDYSLFGKLIFGNKFDFEHWRVSPDGRIVDTYDKLTKVFECPHEHFFSLLNKPMKVNHTYYKLWSKLQDSAIIPQNLPFSNAYLAQHLHKIIPSNSYMNFGILNSLRVWSFFPLDSSITCYSNVGAFGIDGCMSTLLGQSIVTEQLCFLVIGDLAFFYDMNSLGIRHLKNNIRILLINNDGGAEFKLSKLEIDTDKYIAASGHYSNAKGWAEANGFKYKNARTKNEFNQYKEEFVNINSDKPILFEVITSQKNELHAFSCIKGRQNNKKHIQTIIRSIVGQNGMNTIKNIYKSFKRG